MFRQAAIVGACLVTTVAALAWCFWDREDASLPGEIDPSVAPSTQAVAFPVAIGAEVASVAELEELPPPRPWLQGKGHPQPESLLAKALARMHAESVRRFEKVPFNGGGRMGPAFAKKIVRGWTIPWWSPGELSEEKVVQGGMDLQIIHDESLQDFVGNASVANQVTGSGTPGRGKAKTWELKSLDLVGMLKHDAPVVYVSEKLEMTKLKELPTRSLDFFELAGLEELQKGKEVFVRGKEGTIRLLGAVRAAKQCQSCHDCTEGTLLGAFSYTLRIAEYRLFSGDTPIRIGGNQGGNQGNQGGNLGNQGGFIGNRDQFR